jgi:hypothetical protein
LPQKCGIILLRQHHAIRYSSLLKSKRCPLSRQAMQFSRKEIALLVIATVIGIAGLRAEDPPIVLSCLTISWFAFIYICVRHKGSVILRLVGGLVITCGFVLLMLRIRHRQLEDQRDSVWQNLIPEHRIEPGMGDDPQYTVFSVINRGKYSISKKHQIRCLTNFAVGNQGTSPVAGIMSAVVGNKLAFLGIPLVFPILPQKHL